MTACRLIDVVLGTAQTVVVDEKLFTGDRFDDLTSQGEEGRERTQFKHTDADDRSLTLATFTGDRRDLRLDKLISAAATDRERPGADGVEPTYRIVLRDSRPEDDRLNAVLVAAAPDPGPYQSGMSTLRLRFDPDALWNGPGVGVNPFAFLREGGAAVSRVDLDWFCQRAVVEVEAPRASWDLTDPGPAEKLLLERLRSEVGAGVYPNDHRSPLDVADAFIRVARVARQGTATVTRDELLRRAQLRQDYGAVTRVRPADPAVAVGRDRAVDIVAKAAKSVSEGGGVVVVSAPPGHGKSWLCDQLISRLDNAGWLIAEHYCYLNDADDDRQARVVGDSLFGSLLARIADADPAAVAAQRPLLAAGDGQVVDAVSSAIVNAPARPVALIVDGLDHVTRVRNDGIGFDASRAMAESLAALELPPNSVLVVLAQPGSHLEPLIERGATTAEVPALTRPEVAELAALHGLPTVGFEGDVELVDALEERAGGNALYATYLCREVMRDAARVEHAAASVLSMPSFDGTLANYYQHLWSTLERQAWWVAETIGVIDFAVSRDELRAINPGSAHRVAEALEALAPVLVERAGQNRVRIYHESFGRFLRQRLQDDPEALNATLGFVAHWLQTLGMFEDARSFRSLIAVLARAGRHQEAADMVNHDFVVNAVASAMPTTAIRSCLASAASSAVQCGDWATVVRCIELGRAAETLQEERFESTVVAFADVLVTLVGADVVADRLLHEGRTVMTGRSGLQMCAAVDRLGGVPPWLEYMSAHAAEADLDNTSYGDESDLRVELAWLRGRMRLSAASGGPPPAAGTSQTPGPSSPTDDLAAPMRWDALAKYVDDGELSAVSVVGILADTYGEAAVDLFGALLNEPGTYNLAVAEAIDAGRLRADATAQSWARAAAGHGLPAGSRTRLIALGVRPGDDGADTQYDRDVLLQLTREVQQPSVRWEDDVLPSWLDHVAAAAHLDPIGMDAAEALVEGPGWYGCWLRFCIALARVEALSDHNNDAALESTILLLAVDVRPFVGSPRACDLYPIHSTVQARVRRAVSMIQDDDVWERVVEVIRGVGAATSTTLQGELGGPLSSDWVLKLMIETAPASRSSSVREAARTQAAHSNATFYSDIADETLFAARTELDAGDRDAAMDLWKEACRLLVAYGWRKDPTVYELLDPFPQLTEADPRRARERLPALQGVCERVWLHTDGKGTRQAPARWWKLLAAADPVALADLVAPAVHTRSNEPGEHLHDALAELWHAWHNEADPVAVAALRLAMSAPLNSSDADAFSRLVGVLPDATQTGRLLASCLARLDERPPRYPYTNTDEMVASDEVDVTAVNRATKTADAPFVHPLPTPTAAPERSQPPNRRAPVTPDSSAAPLDALVLPEFAPGPVGTARAVRAWQSRPYDDTSDAWTLDRAASVLGYRLLELAQEGRSEEAVIHLERLAERIGLGRDSDLLSALAEGFAIRGEVILSAAAGTLAWTRARGGGGWLAFGGETHLDALRRAFDADAGTALEILGDEISRAIGSDRLGTGVTQALIAAFVTGAAKPGVADDGVDPAMDAGTDTAFACWDAALEVISKRAPRINAYDDPDQPYVPLAPDPGGRAPGDLDAALAAAAIAGVARPEREAKRRALLATKYLLALQPALAATGIKHALANQSDPATLSWLLSLLDQSAGPESPAMVASADSLTALAAGPHLTVRVLARSLSRTPPPLAAPEPADPELVGTTAPQLWTPDPDDQADEDDDVARMILGDVAGQRLTDAEPLLPGLAEATVRRLAAGLDDDALKRKMQSQLQALEDSDARGRRFPDSWLAVLEAAEDALQRGATGARAADLRRGVTQDPVAREAGLAEALLDEPSLALTLEATRQPRPPVPAPPSRYDPQLETLSAETEGPEGDSGPTPAPHGHGPTNASTPEGSGSLYGTLAAPLITDFAELVDAGGGWRVLASVERLRSSTPYGDKQPDVLVTRFIGPEVRGEHDCEGLDHPPFVGGDLEQWGWVFSVTAQFRDIEPLVGMDTRVGVGTDSREGLGLPKTVLVPGGALSAALRATEISGPFVLGDDDGPLAALRTWRCLYDTSDYHQSWPRLEGSALVVTHRAFDRIVAATPRLILRDFVGRNSAPAQG